MATADPASISATFQIDLGLIAKPGWPSGGSTLVASAQFVADRQWWQIPQERRRSADALWRIGEVAIFVMMWSSNDYLAGIVGRCPTCLSAGLSSDVYTQPSFDLCPTCFGVGYSGPHGGVKALLVRPSVWTWDEEQTQWLQRGEVDIQSATITTTGDVWCNRRDFVIRGDGNRFSVNGVSALHFSSGFGTPAHVNDAVTTSLTVMREMPSSSPVYHIGPSGAAVVSLLDPAYPRGVGDFSELEFIDGPIEQR